MPTYDYLCEVCGPFEEFQSISAEPLKTCPKCGAAVKKLISKNVNIIFKGSGFYTTDNRPSSYKEAQKADSGSNTSSSVSNKAS